MAISIFNIRLNKLGQVGFDASMGGTQRTMEFVVLPLDCGSQSDRVIVRSAENIGWITKEGHIYMSPQIQGGVQSTHLAMCVAIGNVTSEALFNLKTYVFCSTGNKTRNATAATKTDRVVAA